MNKYSIFFKKNNQNIKIKNLFLRIKFFLRKIIIVKQKNNFSEINWDDRFKKLGVYGLIDTRHPKNELSYVTKEQKRIIFPYFKSMLNGNEMNILDFGCGSGRFTHDLASILRKRTGGGAVIGTDVTQGYISLAKKKKTMNVKFIHSNFFFHEFKKNFDAVWVCMVFGGISDDLLVQISRKITMRLNPNGLLFIIEATGNSNKNGAWKIRTVKDLLSFFPKIRLKKIITYTDAGQEISIIAGRKF